MRFESILAIALPALVAAAPTPQDPDFEFPADVPEEGIVGGTTARAGEYPFMVSLHRSSGQQFCGGSLYNANTVITAAHCSTPTALGGAVSGITVRGGSLTKSSGGTLVRVSRIISHPNYNENTMQNDIAIWKLASPIAASSSVSYIKLPAAGSDPASGSTAQLAGWGSIRENGPASETLLRVDVPIVARNTCISSYRGVSGFEDSPPTTNMVCAGYTQGGRDSCQGDSGGPLMDASKTHIGVVSYGAGCARAGLPGIYTRTANYISFITSNA